MTIGVRPGLQATWSPASEGPSTPEDRLAHAPAGRQCRDVRTPVGMGLLPGKAGDADDGADDDDERGHEQRAQAGGSG